MARIRYLGHAGFVVEHGEHRLLMDPWFHSAFLQSWFPYPDNRALLPSVLEGRYDHVWISHFHEDHFDVELLRRLDKDITILLADFRSKSLPKSFADMGFENVVTLAAQGVAGAGAGPRGDDVPRHEPQGGQRAPRRHRRVPLPRPQRLQHADVRAAERRRPAGCAVLGGDVVPELLRLPAGGDAGEGRRRAWRPPATRCGGRST